MNSATPNTQLRTRRGFHICTTHHIRAMVCKTARCRTKILHMKAKKTMKQLPLNAIRGNTWNKKLGQQKIKELMGYHSN